MTKNQAALVGAATCGAGGAAGGVLAAHNGIEGSHRNEAAGAGIGLVIGALLCGGLAYLIATGGETSATTTATTAEAGATTTTGAES